MHALVCVFAYVHICTCVHVATCVSMLCIYLSDYIMSICPHMHVHIYYCTNVAFTFTEPKLDILYYPLMPWLGKWP